ncbi:MAG: hypothetical protein P1U74_10645 [Legionellaceae bacterium]|nr:hypothetical protein [Legionellaceae bacterium]
MITYNTSLIINHANRGLKPRNIPGYFFKPYGAGESSKHYGTKLRRQSTLELIGDCLGDFSTQLYPLAIGLWNMSVTVGAVCIPDSPDDRGNPIKMIPAVISAVILGAITAVITAALMAISILTRTISTIVSPIIENTCYQNISSMTPS